GEEVAEKARGADSRVQEAYPRRTQGAVLFKVRISSRTPRVSGPAKSSQRTIISPKTRSVPRIRHSRQSPPQSERDVDRDCSSKTTEPCRCACYPWTSKVGGESSCGPDTRGQQNLGFKATDQLPTTPGQP